MSLTIPLHSEAPHYFFQTELDGASYGFEVLWNEIAGGWILSLYTADDVPILTGLRIVLDLPLTVRYADTRLPPGVLIAQDTSGGRVEAARNDLGTRVQLLYFTAAERAAL